MKEDSKFKRDFIQALRKIARELEAIRKHFTEPEAKKGTEERKD